MASTIGPATNAAAEVFDVFELVEIIFEFLPLEDLVRAQRVNLMARNVVVQTPRFREGHTVYEPGSWLAKAPFCQVVDFCIPLSGDDDHQYLYLLGNHTHCLFDAGGDEFGLMRLTFDLSYEPHPDWKRDEAGDLLCDRTIISPIPLYGVPDEPTLPHHESLQLWRDVSWTAETFGSEEVLVELILRGKCDRGHVTEDRMLFEPGTTIDQTVARLIYFIDRWPTKSCPGGEPQFCHRRKFHLEGDTLYARTTCGQEREKVGDKPFAEDQRG